jgi:hypothetical protein
MILKFLQVKTSPDSGVLNLLNRNVIGTPGFGMLYQHRGTLQKINKITNPFFVNLVKKTDIIGTCCFCKRAINKGEEQLTAFYIRYFTFKHSFRRKNVTPKKALSTSTLRQEVTAILDGHQLDVKPTEKFYHYAYVDPRNVRSATLCTEFGFERVREYATIIFSRLNPQKKILSMSEASAEDQLAIIPLLSDFYKNFNMYSAENIFNGRTYYVVKDEHGKILAGTQANPDNWRILSLPGVSGTLILNIFSRLPVLKKLINKDYRFITLEGIYYAPGCENILEILFENLLAKYQVNSAIMVVDAQTSLYNLLRSLNLGPADKLNKEVRGNVICRFVNFTDHEKKDFYNAPAYISGIDVT